MFPTSRIRHCPYRSSRHTSGGVWLSLPRQKTHERLAWSAAEERDANSCGRFARSVAIITHFTAGFNVDPKSLNSTQLQQTQAFAQKAHSLDPVEFLLNIIPSSFFNAFASGDILQVLLVAILSGFAISFMGTRGNPMLTAVDMAAKVFFGIMRIVVKVAPVGAFGAMAFTVGSQGLGALKSLGYLMFCFYLTAGLFVVIVLGSIATFNGFSIFRYLNYIKEELLLVLGTSSSETALPGMLQKMQRLGCSPSTVGLVIPTGYSFNLDGTNIYMTMAAVFLAQATDTHLDLGQQLVLLVVAMLSSKGATGVTGAGFITLAATERQSPKAKEPR